MVDLDGDALATEASLDHLEPGGDQVGHRGRLELGGGGPRQSPEVLDDVGDALHAVAGPGEDVLQVLADVGPVDLLAQLLDRPEHVGRGGGQGPVRRLVVLHHLQDPLEVAFEHGQVIADVGQRVVDLVRHAGAEQPDRGQLVGPRQHGAHPLAFGLVADRPDELQLAGQLDRVERQFEREGLAILPEPLHLHGLADDPGVVGLQVARESLVVGLAEPVGHERGQGLAEDLVGRPAEGPRGGGVVQHDPPVPIGDDDRVEAPLGQLAIAGLRLGQGAVLRLQVEGAPGLRLDELATGLLQGLTLGDVADHGQDGALAFEEDRRGVDVDGDHAPVLGPLAPLAQEAALADLLPESLVIAGGELGVVDVARRQRRGTPRGCTRRAGRPTR